jgi:hypothetical protein
MILGPRRGRFYDAQGEPLDTPKPFPGHSVALQLLGYVNLLARMSFHLSFFRQSSSSVLTYSSFCDLLFPLPRQNTTDLLGSTEQ